MWPYLYAQLEIAEEINQNRIKTYNMYYSMLKPLEEDGLIELPYVPEDCVTQWAYVFY